MSFKVIDTRQYVNVKDIADFIIDGDIPSDEAFLHQYFHYFLHQMYHDDFVRNMYCDGFEEKLDPAVVPPNIFALAKRLGYYLKDGMWIEYKK